MATKTVTQSDGTVQVSWESGYTQVKRLAPGIAFLRLVGFMPGVAFDEMIKPLARELEAHSSLAIFCDTTGFTRYKSEYRARWIEFLKSSNGKVQGYLLVKSALIRVGVRLINLSVKAIQAYSDQPSFDAACKEVYPAYQKASLPLPLTDDVYLAT